MLFDSGLYEKNWRVLCQLRKVDSLTLELFRDHMT